MAVETQAVQIRIDVVDANSAQAVQQVQRNIEGMGAAGAASGEKIAQGMDKIKGHSLSALDNVRLLRDDIGIRIPRSMEKAIASSQMMMTAIKSIGGGLLAIGAIDIGIRIATGLYDAYQKYLSLTKAAEDYGAAVEKARQENFTDTHSLETTRARIDEATDAAKNFADQAKEAQKAVIGWRSALDLVAPGAGSLWQSLHGRSQAHDLTQQQYQQQAAADKLRQERESEQYHQQQLTSVEWQHAGDARLRGEQKINAELQKRQQLNAEERRYNNERDRIYGNNVPANAGASEEGDKNQIAQKQAEAELFNLRRQQAQELMHLQQAAVQAGLRGSALYHAQEAAALDDLKFKDMDSVAARNAIHLKFHNEELKRIQDEEFAIQKMRGETAVIGLTGAGKIQQEGRNRLNDEIYNNPNAPTNPGQRLAVIGEITRQTNAQLLEAEREFTQRVDALADDSAAHQISGFARIRAEAQKQIDALTKEFQKLYGTNVNAPMYQAHVGELNRGVGLINAGAGMQTADLARKNAEETAQLESEARAKYLSAEKQQTAAIDEEYQERLRKFQEELEQQQISQQDYDRRIVAAAQIRDAQLAESARQAREKMAGEFTRFFSNPLQGLKEMGNKAGGEAAAALVQRVQGRYQGTGGGEHLGMPGSIFDRIAGVPHGTNAGHLGSPASSSKMISLASAQIQIGSANIAFGGVSSTAASGGGGGVGASAGSTSLLSAGARFGGFGSTASGDAGISSGSTSSSPASFSSSGSTVGGAGAIGAGAGGVIGDVQQSVGLFNQAKGIFGASSASGGTSGLASLIGSGGVAGAAGSTAKSGFGASLLGGGGMSAAGGAVSGGLGLFSAFEGSGGVGGALSGAMSGMKLGMMVGGPIGAAIGAAGGAIIGAIGFGGREKARVYDLKTVRPRIQQDILSYQQGGMDYTSAYSDMQSLDTEAKKALYAMGSAGHSYYWDTVIGEIHQAEGKLSAEQRAGRSNYTVSGASYASGIDSIPETGWNLNHEGERIIDSSRNERITRALEAGADSRMMAAQPSSSWGGDIHVHALDAKSSIQWLMANKHNVRAAMNASFAENSGGADA